MLEFSFLSWFSAQKIPSVVNTKDIFLVETVKQ